MQYLNNGEYIVSPAAYQWDELRMSLEQLAETFGKLNNEIDKVADSVLVLGDPIEDLAEPEEQSVDDIIKDMLK